MIKKKTKPKKSVSAVPIHQLKTWTEHFSAIMKGEKTFEIRFNDRCFCIGDMLHLQEYCPQAQIFSGRELFVTVTHILRGNHGIEPMYIVMSIKIIE